MEQVLRRTTSALGMLMASRKRRAFIFTPPIALFLFVPFFLTGDPLDDFGYYMQRLGRQFTIMLLLSPMWLFLAYITIGLVYLPFYGLFRRLNHRSLLAVMAAAAIASMIFYALPDLFSLTNETTYFAYSDCIVIQHGQRTACGWRHFWNGITIWAIYGAVVGAIFWFLYAGGWRFRLRPDEPWT